VKNNQNDTCDADAIGETMTRPGRRFLAVESAAQTAPLSFFEPMLQRFFARQTSD
jgi:hypothetical protein